MIEQLVAVVTIVFLLVFWGWLNSIGDKSDKRFFLTVFPIGILGVFLGGVLNLW